MNGILYRHIANGTTVINKKNETKHFKHFELESIKEKFFYFFSESSLYWEDEICRYFCMFSYSRKINENVEFDADLNRTLECFCYLNFCISSIFLAVSFALIFWFWFFLSFSSQIFHIEPFFKIYPRWKLLLRHLSKFSRASLNFLFSPPPSSPPVYSFHTQYIFIPFVMLQMKD